MRDLVAVHYPKREENVRDLYRAQSVEMEHARHRYHSPANAGTKNGTMRIVPCVKIIHPDPLFN